MEPFVIDRAHPPRALRYRDPALGRSLLLRPWDFTDCDRLIAAVNDSTPELKPYMPWAHEPPTREGEYALLARFHANFWGGHEYVFGSFADDGSILGGVGLHPRTALNPRALELGYWCHSAHAGKGWTTLASRLLVVLAFDRFGCDRLQLIHAVDNVASQRVAEKLGFRYEATLRGLSAEVPAKLLDGGYRGSGWHKMHAMFADDFAQLPWVAATRAHTTLVDALGGAHAPSAG